MNWKNIKLIFLREVRDQLRDRRTLFMIAVLPLLMYPLLGMSILQVSQFLREQPTKILIVDLPQMPDLPPLVSDHRFDLQWLGDPKLQSLFDLERQPPAEDKSSSTGGGALNEALNVGQARQAVHAGKFQAVLIFPKDFASQLQRIRTQLQVRQDKPADSVPDALAVPNPTIVYNAANEKSQLAFSRVASVLRSWAEAIGKQNLKDSQLPEDVAKPFEIKNEDVAESQQRQAAMWSKILPFVLLLWALTGAFYPAIDLCAGEKERGTLETLLCSPAQRGEIVAGKLLTVMLFSISTSVLNLASMGITGSLVLSHIPAPDGTAQLGIPPLLAQLWLLAALVPVSALFSALCIALASFARSSKEGQYYLMPLVLITLPLVIVPMGPGMDLNLGNSLIPLTGVVLLLKNLLEGNYATAWPYVAPVAGVTLLCCLMAVRWAVEQFNKESVLFRESERLDVGLWLRHLLRDRGNTPSVAEALFCGVIILMVKFFLSLSMPAKVPDSFDELAKATIITQLVVAVTPALLMTIMLTRSAKETLSLRLPAWWAIPGAVLLAVALHPAIKWFETIVVHLYPISDSYKELGKVLEMGTYWQLLLLIAVLPAICEELAFRGFMLSGLRHIGHKWWAVALCSLFFGFAHGLFQQSIVTFVVGMAIGYVVVQTGSIFVGMAFHFAHNALALTAGQLQEGKVLPNAKQFFERLVYPIGNGDDFAYRWWVVALGALVAAGLLVKFHRLAYRKTEEEALQETIDRQPAIAIGQDLRLGETPTLAAAIYLPTESSTLS